MGQGRPDRRGALNFVAHGRQPLAGIHVLRQLDTAREQFVESRHDVVAGNDTDAQSFR